jgi:energy-coupling factor transport system substrate-specific component
MIIMTSTTSPALRPTLRWRVVDIAVASVIGVASALIYWLVALISTGPWNFLEAIIPGFGGIINGLWLFAGPLAAVIVRKPGAAVYAEVVAAVLEALMGNMWGGGATFAIGLVQGLMAELALVIVLYRMWNPAVLIFSGALSGLGCWGYSFFTNLQAIDWGGSYGIIYLVTTVLSGALIAGVLMWYLYIAIAKTGALDHFVSGREVRGVSD